MGGEGDRRHVRDLRRAGSGRVDTPGPRRSRVPDVLVMQQADPDAEVEPAAEHGMDAGRDQGARGAAGGAADEPAKAGASMNRLDPRELADQLRDDAEQAIEQAVADLGGAAYTGRDATRVLLGYADMTSTTGGRRPGPLARPERWRQSFALKLALAVRGVL